MAFCEDVYTATLPDSSQLVLRPPELHEIEALVPVPEEVKRYIGSDALDGTGIRIAQAFSGSIDGQTCWGIQAQGRIVGLTGLVRLPPVDDYPSGFVYVIDPEVWGQGIGSCACTITIHHAFSQPDPPDAVCAYAHKDNERSVRMLEGIGFRPKNDRVFGLFGWNCYLLPNPDLQIPDDPTKRSLVDPTVSQLLADKEARNRYLSRVAKYAIKKV